MYRNKHTKQKQFKVKKESRNVGLETAKQHFLRQFETLIEVQSFTRKYCVGQSPALAKKHHFIHFYCLPKGKVAKE